MAAERSPEQIAQALESQIQELPFVHMPDDALGVMMPLDLRNSLTQFLRRLSAPPAVVFANEEGIHVAGDSSKVKDWTVYSGPADEPAPATCQTCKHWEHVKDDKGYCGHNETYVRSDGEYTTADFGCTLHEALDG